MTDELGTAVEHHIQIGEQKRSEAEHRAEILLRSMLTDEQVEQLDRMSAFVVETETKKYLVRHRRRVQELDADGNPIAAYCIHPRKYVPGHDTMLAQKLLLEADEAEFLRIANKSALV